MLDELVEQEIANKWRNAGACAPPIAPARNGKQLLYELAHLLRWALSNVVCVFQECSELLDIRGVSRNRERCQPLLDLQVVEESQNNAGVGGGGHRFEYACYRTLGE